jgi:mRNA interferase RelE/StbE
MFQVKYSDKAVKQLKKLDVSNRKLIINWIAKNLEGCENPRMKGKGLTADRSGEWRYRIGSYRMICDIRDSELVILALSIGHRKDIYKK